MPSEPKKNSLLREEILRITLDGKQLRKKCVKGTLNRVITAFMECSYLAGRNWGYTPHSALDILYPNGYGYRTWWVCDMGKKLSWVLALYT